jgi:hypothetical protein
MAGQLCPLCDRPIEPGQPVAFRQGMLRHLSCIDAGAREAAPTNGTSRAEEPTVCAACDQEVAAGQEIVRLPDGQVEHARCPRPVCPVCTKPVHPDEAARRFRSDMFHDACWTRRSRTIAGGSGDAP